ncbi:hypothetical protein [Rossellomorea aquimaris]|uniref:hypothetical protein n=1 Tax=Rossellomorea aquimaris TaxID=189382 RepID=UPI0007D08D01|nr:hypothetical protein [Rossellomorea aquimaris]
MKNIIDVAELKQKILYGSSAFLTGNGFSINFDKDFFNIYGNLYSAHRKVLKESQYKVLSNKAFKKRFKDNYKFVLNHVVNFKEEDLMNIFEEGSQFAISIIDNEELIAFLKENKVISELSFGVGHLEPLYQICKTYNENGIKSVNVEHWTILIYFYVAIKRLKPKCYIMPSNNLFLTLLRQGDRSPIRLFSESESLHTHLHNDVISNGFTTYFRMLFSIAILSNGKSVNLLELENKSKLNVTNICAFLNNFDVLISLNYDRILEEVSGGRKVEHMHGEFVVDKEEYVYNQSLGVRIGDTYISFSDILIGDYFVFKSFLPNVNNFSSKKNRFNKQTSHFSQKMNNIIHRHSIDTVLIFGMNIENDFHVLRNLMLEFHSLGVNTPQIIYSYFNEVEKREFIETYDKVITFREDVNKYCRENIKLSFIKTQDILEAHFKSDSESE